MWARLLHTTFCWVGDDVVQELNGWMTGLAASVLLLAQAALMSRVPVLERACGHRVVGLASFDLMLLHVALITWGAPPATLPRCLAPSGA